MLAQVIWVWHFVQAQGSCALSFKAETNLSFFNLGYCFCLFIYLNLIYLKY